MFESVGWGEILLLVLVGLFVLGPERLPAAIRWVASTLRTVREYATGARNQLRDELGPELEQFREPLEELRRVRGADPRTAVRRHLFDAPDDGSWSGTATPASPEPAQGLPAAGADGAIKSRSATPDPLTPGEQAPLDPDAT